MIHNFHNQIMYSTLRIEVTTHERSTMIGTGFLFLFDNLFPCLVTNKHVVSNFKTATIVFTKRDEENKPMPGQYVYCDITDCLNDAIPHPSNSVDLVAIPLKSILAAIPNQNKGVFCFYFTPENIPDEKDFDWIYPGKNVLMVGYPLGLIDKTNNLPIMRRGIIASDPALDFGDSHGFLADIAANKGSSGSPVIVTRERFAFNSGTGNIDRIEEWRLIGIAYLAHVFFEPLQLFVDERPFGKEIKLQESANLVYLIPSSRLKDLNSIIQKRYFSENN